MINPTLDTAEPPLSETVEAVALPLCVDLDGTLIQTDTLLEAVLALIRKYPLMSFALPYWLFRGKAYLKTKVAEHSPLDVSLLPLQLDFLSFLEQEHRNGRTLVLATAAHFSYAERVAARLNIFSEVLATGGSTNLRGGEKSRVLCERFGHRQFDYAANAFADIPVWESASSAILVNGPARLATALTRRSIQVTRVFDRGRNRWKALFAAMRPHQWVKNLLAFAPLFLSHQFLDPGKAAQACVAFVCLSLCASGVYLLNDLLDLESDRHHHRKSRRPLASGAAPIGLALVGVPVLTLAAFALGGFLLPAAFLAAMGGYLLATIAYSVWIKGQLLIDVIVLAGLYTARIIAGGAATHISVSPWTLSFAVAVFLSLALVKRYSELRHLRDREDVPGRAYRASDVSVLSSSGLASGYMSVIVLALYINSAEVSVLYSKPLWLWPICLLDLYFISRFWLLAHRGQVHEDPVVFALRDPVNLVLVVIAILFIYLAV